MIFLWENSLHPVKSVYRRDNKVKTIEECVVMAMDGADPALYPFLPYILQDIWEIGASPDIIVHLLQDHCRTRAGLRLLDLGCGKGVVSIQAAAEIGISCLGIDAVEAFVAEARSRAAEYKVDSLCRFEVGDIRLRVKELSGFDVIVLGAIGPVFGDYRETLVTLSPCLKPDGLFIIDEGYFPDDSPYTHSIIRKKSALFGEIAAAGMEVVDEVVIGEEEIREADSDLFDKLKARCLELAEAHPDRKNLFLDYIRRQIEENSVLEDEAVCSTMVIRRKK
ncbi:MAG: class I SAM-dependent methyltransferase [Candidatus Aminicenantes bacterium]|nr:class I SAM-dependent methyltransferase [Candidatus Aminicenantes bacterium]